MMSDEAFSIVLDGIQQQCRNVEVQGGTKKIQYLQTLIYSNNQIGRQSLIMLESLIPNMVEIVFNNLTLDKGKDEPADKKKSLYEIINEVLLMISDASTKLMKLKMRC